MKSKYVLIAKFAGSKKFEALFIGTEKNCEKRREILEKDLEDNNDEETEVGIISFERYKNLRKEKKILRINDWRIE
jgi:hypothetical protein